MKKTILVASGTWKNIPGDLILEVEDMASADWSQQKSKIGKPMQGKPRTIEEWKQRFGGLSGELVHPVGQHKFMFDLSPWANVDGARYLKLEWSFKATPPVPVGDPHYPKRS
ncbi:MAG: hypothetical protein ACJ788_22150 [Ktedonobacteraceae bacterium]